MVCQPIEIPEPSAEPGDEKRFDRGLRKQQPQRLRDAGCLAIADHHDPRAASRPLPRSRPGSRGERLRREGPDGRGERFEKGGERGQAARGLSRACVQDRIRR
jgi:hypothetical protein